MNLNKIVIGIFFAAIGTSCGTKTKADNNYQNDSAGFYQTEAKKITSKTDYGFSVINEDLEKPWGVISMPDGRLLITEKSGTFRIADSNGKVSDKINIAPALNINDGGQGGLLDLILDENFSSNKTIYFTFSENYESGTLTSVAKGNLSSDERSVENVKVIYRANPSYDGLLHYGGRIAIDNDGHLLVTTGERSDRATRPLAQDKKTALGKILKMDKDGKAISTNPFIESGEAIPELYSYGHRNVQGLAYDHTTGKIWSTEMGPKGGDELNLILPGKDYGWPTITYGKEYTGASINNGKTHQEGMEQPIYYWAPSESPSGTIIYLNNAIPEWKGNIFIGCLSGQKIIRLVLENDRVVGEEFLLEDEGSRFRDLAEGKDGAIYAVTDEGKLYKIFKK